MSFEGAVPPLYREVYDIVSPQQEHIDQDLFVHLLLKTSLPRTTISQFDSPRGRGWDCERSACGSGISIARQYIMCEIIWDMVDNKQGYITRTGLYKALALTALAQQGKTVSEKLLETFSGQELPKPNLGDLSDLRATSVKVRRNKNPNDLGYSFYELCGLDNIKVELVPEKKGLILKHVEYEVTSQTYKTTVLRRYNDFLAFQELLMMRFPYRLIPRLPPKKMMGANREFIEGRRKSLRRFLNLIARHPQMYDDKLVKFFFTFTGSDVQHKIRESFRGIPDEFMTSNLASTAKDLVPMDTQTQLSNSKEHIRILYNSVCKLKDIIERMVMRATNYACDMLQFGQELSQLSSDNTPMTAWATGTNSTWSNLQRGFKHLSVEYAALGDKASQEAGDLDDLVLEKICFLQDMLIAYRDLCERHEKGVLSDHQRAIAKMGQYKKKKMSATVSTSEVGAVEQLEQKILQQESQIANMENRNYYSLHCLQMETQLIHANLEILYDLLSAMAKIQSKSHSDLGKVWSDILPIIENLHSSSVSTRTSPVGSPVNNHTGITV